MIWIQMKSGKNMPVNPNIVSFIGGGSDRIVLPEGEVVSGKIIHGEYKDPEEVGFGYISHFATCPNADAHRRRR